MKKLMFVLLSILMAGGTFAQSDADFIFLHPRPNAVSITSVFAITPTKWIAGGGGGGLLMMTTNSGQIWDVKYFFRPYIPPSLAVYPSVIDLHFFNENVGLVSCNDGYIGRTTNGGLTWDSIPSGTINGVRKFFFLDNSIGYLCGSNGYLAKTTNAGLTWSLMNSSVTSTIYNVSAPDTNIIFFATTSGNVYKSTDGGNTWSAKNIGVTSIVNDVYFVDPNVGFAVTTNSIRKTTNGGETWFPLLTTSLTFRDIAYYENVGDPGGNNVIYFTGHSTTNASYLYRSYDLGQTLDSIDMRSGKPVFSSVYTLSRNGNVLINGSDVGMVAYSTDRGNTWNTSGQYLSSSTILDVEVHQPSRKIWAGGTKATNQANPIYSTDFGQTWMEPLNSCNFQINRILFLNDQVGFAAGVQRRIFRSTNGGVNWDSCAIPAGTSNLWGLFTSDQNTIWAVGGIGFVVKSTDAGLTWNVINPQTNASLWGGAASEPNKIFIVGGNTTRGIIKRTTDGGASWDSLAFLSSSQLRTIHFISQQIGFISGDNGQLYKTTDGGDTWIQFSSPVTGSIEHLRFIDENTGFMNLNSLDGLGMYKTSDGGLTWKRFGRLPRFTSGNGFRVINADSVVSAGSVGTVTLFFDPLSIPVELNSFTANVDGNNVSLYWSTATELNNRGFEIERKTSTSDQWITVGFVEGSGTSTESRTYVFEDYGIRAGSYNYRLKQIDFDGTSKIYNLSETVIVGIPNKFELLQNYPNPFNPSTRISFSIPQRSDIKIKIYDILGNEVATLVDELREAGYYSIEFDGSNLSSGIYFYTIQAGNFYQVKKMTLIK
ncbi:MAG: YCF48-related protein [Ignavibacterium sp.]